MSIILSDLTARYGTNVVVNRVSLEINDGELFVLLGGSGSGKSTILRMIAGLTPPASGRIEINGRDVTHLPPQARGTGFVFQNYSVFRHMTVTENVEFGLRIRGVGRAARHQRSTELLDLVGLGGLGDRFPDQLSGGQQQRVAVARALAYEPEVLLLDEPFSALDVKIRAELRQSFKEIQRELDVTTILVTHDQEEAFELADRIGVIERGFLMEVNTPQALYHQPRTEFAATFVGGGNVLVGRMEQGQIKLGAVSLPLPPGAPPHEEDTPVRLLFRPETVYVGAAPPAEGSDIHTLGEARVCDEIFSGSQQRLRLEMHGFEGVRSLWPPPPYGRRVFYIEAIQTSDRAVALTRPAPGDHVWVGLRRYHVLEPSGLKLLIAYAETPGGQAAAAFGALLARAASGPTTLLAVAEAEQVAAARETLEELRRRWPGGPSPRLTTRVRQGAIAAEVLAEAQEGDYELVVLGRGRDGLGSVAQQILKRTETPVLLVQETRPQIARVLICTAVGEPGKTDVRFGGRVARRTRAAVTVFHVVRPGAAPWERARAEQHMAAAQAVLDTLGVAAETKITGQRPEGRVADIAAEAEAGDYDLIVIGAPAWQHPARSRWTDFASQIVRSTSRPVLIAPMVP
ncbi:MAG: ATP-binding cassette domain-containing protein [Chloroflexi bacterium]|nr:ATP-binding cassette domain-containing protein [Chloroflexota bacterium]